MSALQTLIINLKRQPERRAYAQSESLRCGLRPVILDATDARQLTASWIEQNTTADLQEKLRLPSYHSMNPGALACADSHRRAWGELLKLQRFPALILEDDFFWLEAPNAVLRALAAVADSDFDIILLGYSPRHRFPIQQLSTSISPDGHFVIPYQLVGRTSGSYAYLLSKRGAERLLTVQSVTIDREADDFAAELQRQGDQIRLGLMYPPLVHHGLFDSSIWSTSLTLRHALKRCINSACVRSTVLRRVLSWAMKRRLRRNYAKTGESSQGHSGT